MHILLTRPLDDCYEMILKFKSLGHKVSNLPLLNILTMSNQKYDAEIYWKLEKS